MHRLVVLVLAVCSSTLGAQASLLKDINTEVNEESSFPNYLTVSGGRLYFAARYGGLAGLLPWVSDGTASGTLMLKDISSNTSDSTMGITPFGSGVVFSAGNPVHGRELWISDGTIAGTQMVTDLNSGPAAGCASFFAEVNGQILFRGDDGSTGMELWATDGTAGGTTLVKDIVTGTGTSDPRDFVVAGNKLFFTATTPATGRELWVSDGTPSGTFMLSDILAGTGTSNPIEISAIGSEVYFSASDGTNGVEPWKSDGTVAGTVMIADIVSGAGHSFPTQFRGLTSGDVVFTAETPAEGREIWITDGTSANTQLVIDLRPGTVSSNPSHLYSMGGYVLCAADDGSSVYDELWRTDGTIGGTTLVRNINTSPNTGSDPRFFTALGTDCFFYAVGGATQTGLWKTDGTTAGTVLIRDAEVNAGPVVPMVAGSSEVFFAGRDYSGVSDVEPWRSDGTTAGTALIKNIWFESEGSLPQTFTDLGGNTVFWATDSTNGREPWVTDGTSAGTLLLGDILPGQSSNFVSRVVPYGGIGFFTADDGTNGRELWTTDGTPGGTALFLDIFTGSGSSAPDKFTEMNGLLYFTASNGTNGRELWVTDGTVGGTQMVADIFTGSSSSSPDELTVFGSELFFAASSPSLGVELWKSDGTAAGTVLVLDIWNAGGSVPQDFMVINSMLLFTANDGTNGRELWSTAGTSGTTAMLVNINPGAASSSATWLGTVNGYAFFRAAQAATGTELWRTDGTAAGTILLADATAGTGSGSALFKAMYGNRMVYTASSAANGSEPWITDGTTAGTFMLADINPGAAHSGATWLGTVSGGFVLAANHATYGNELWISDGTQAGTGLLVEVFSGPQSGLSLFTIGEYNGTVYFSGRTENEGGALWQTDGTAAGTVLADDIVPGADSATIFALHQLGTKLILRITTVPFGAEPWVYDAAGTNLAPVVSLSATSGAYTENGAQTMIATGATVTDSDSADFDGGYLRLEVTQGATAADLITVQHQGTGAGQVGVSGSIVSYGGVSIGGFTGGAGTSAFVLTFNASADPAAAEAVLRAMRFEIQSDNPTSATRIIEVTVSDGDGGISTPQQFSITVTPVNDLPVMDLPTSGQTNFQGSAGGPFTATLQPTTPQMPNMRLEVSDPDSVPTLTAISVMPSAPASMFPPAVPQNLPNGTVLDWTGNTANSLPGTYTWTLTITDGVSSVFVSVSITIPDIAPQHNNGSDSSGSGTASQPYFANSFVGTQPSRYMTEVSDPCLLHSASIQSVTPDAGNPSSVWSITMTPGAGARQLYATPNQTLVIGDIGTHDFTAIVTDGTLTTTFYLRLEVYPASNQPPDINTGAASQFVKNSTSPITTFTLMVDPATIVTGIATLELADPNGDDVEITQVTPPTSPMNNVAISYVGGLQTSPYQFEFIGTAEAFDPPGPHRWDLTAQDQFGNSEQFEIYIVINNYPPGHAAGPDSTSGTGTSGDPYRAAQMTGSALDLEVVQIVDPNTAENHVVTGVIPVSVSGTANIQFAVDQATHRIQAFTTLPLTAADVGTYEFEVNFADTTNTATAWVRIDVSLAPPGGGGGSGGSGGSSGGSSGGGGGEDSGCSAGDGHGHASWLLFGLSVLTLLRLCRRLARRGELG